LKRITALSSHLAEQAKGQEQKYEQFFHYKKDFQGQRYSFLHVPVEFLCLIVSERRKKFPKTALSLLR
jgi:hypothetical protein